MKIILDRDVPGVGSAGDVKEVSAGFARNYLLPRRLAWPYSEGLQKSFQTRKKTLDKKVSALKQKALDRKTALEKYSLEFNVQVDEHGKMYGSIGKGQVLKALRQKGAKLPKEAKLLLTDSIKAAGTFKAPIQLYRDVVAEVPVTVVAGAAATK